MPPEAEFPRRRPPMARLAAALVAVGVIGAVMVVSRHQPPAHQVVTQGATTGDVPATPPGGDGSAAPASAGSPEPETAAASPASAPTSTSGPSGVRPATAPPPAAPAVKLTTTTRATTTSTTTTATAPTPTVTAATGGTDSSTTSTTGRSSGASGVEGTVGASPTCPVERADDPCPPRPVETAVRVVRADGTVAAQTQSGPDGRFRVEVAPGRYSLEADYPSGPGGGCTPVDVVVEASGFTHADIDCDTGIR